MGDPFWPGCAADPGHIAGIMPGHPELWNANSGRFAIINDSPEPPKRRMTMTAPAIWNATDLVVGVVTGIDKAGRVANYSAQSIEPVHCPIKVVDGVKSAKSFFVTNVSIGEIS